MRTLSQLATTADVAGFAATFSEDVDKHLAAVQRAARAKLRRREAAQAADERARREKQEREAPLTAARIELARKGLERLAAFGQSKPMQQILGSLQRISRINDHVTFYEVSRPSGDDWEMRELKYGALRMVVVDLYEGRLQIFAGAYRDGSGGDGPMWHFGYDSSVKNREGEASIDEFWQEVAGPYAANLSLARCWKQHSYEWQAVDVAFQFLVSCARKRQFERYIKECMSALAEKMSKHLD